MEKEILHEFSQDFLAEVNNEFRIIDPGYTDLKKLIFNIKYFEGAEPDYKNPRKFWNRDAELLKLIDFLTANEISTIRFTSKNVKNSKGVTIKNELAVKLLIECIQSNIKEPETPETWIKKKQKTHQNFNPSIEQAESLMQIELMNKPEDKAHYLVRKDIKRHTKKGNTKISANYAFVMDMVIQRIREFLKIHSTEPVIKRYEYYFVGLVLKEAEIMFTDKPDLTPEDCKSSLQHWFDKLEKSKTILTLNDF